jgi:two-component system, chemotaxis family, chemotaxis protein CheY
MAKRVMIVDDSLRWRMELRDLLASHGFSVVAEASNGRQAIDMYDRISPDIVMVDAVMPDMDGVCTIREIRYKDQQALLVLCAASGERATVNEAITAGAADFCVKPYVPRAVLSVLRRAMCGIGR